MSTRAVQPPPPPPQLPEPGESRRFRMCGSSWGGETRTAGSQRVSDSHTALFDSQVPKKKQTKKLDPDGAIQQHGGGGLKAVLKGLSSGDVASDYKRESVSKQKTMIFQNC